MTLLFNVNIMKIKAMKQRLTLLIAVFLLAFIGAWAGTLAALSTDQPAAANTNPGLNYETVSYAEVWQEASPAVVSVVALKDLSEINRFSIFGTPLFPNDDSYSSGELSEVSSGTGFIITEDGLVVTNRHVVQDEAAQYVVVMSDGAELEAEVLGRDTLNDIALLRIAADSSRNGKLPHLDFANSDEIVVGEPVLAIGNALGEYSNTSTAGIISATGRRIYARSGDGSSSNLVDLIQTDAAINPGNSGGPLLSLDGTVLGMNTAVSSAAQGIGFAIPANDIAHVVASYQEFGRIVRPYLGVRFLMVTPTIKDRLSLDVDYGAVLVGDSEAGFFAVQPGGAAEKAGLQEGDVILRFGDHELTPEFSLQNALAGYLVGEELALDVWRDGHRLKLKMTLEASPEL
jgi:serine protease Do